MKVVDGGDIDVGVGGLTFGGGGGNCSGPADGGVGGLSFGGGGGNCSGPADGGVGGSTSGSYKYTGVSKVTLTKHFISSVFASN